jgi:hypothetical protein
VKKVESPQSFYATLIRSLERKVSEQDATSVAAAVRALPADAPLTLDVIDRLGLNAGLRANLIFAWLHHRYPELIENEVTAGDTLADILRRLTADATKIPAPLVEFHESLAQGPELGAIPELAAIELLLDEGKLKYFAEQSGKIVFVAEHGGREIDLAIEKKKVTWEGGTVDLEAIAPKYLKRMQQALARAAKNAALGKDGLKLQRELEPIIENWQAPVHPVLARLETLLRLELGVLRVGESNLEVLNTLIEQVLETSQLAMSGAAAQENVEEVLAELVARRPRLIAEDPPSANTKTEPPQSHAQQPKTQEQSRPQGAQRVRINVPPGSHARISIDESLGQLVVRLEQLSDTLSRIRR